jgi:hypothetical protein
VALLAAAAAVWSGYEAHLGRIDAANLGRDMLLAHVEATRLDERPFIVPMATGWKLDTRVGIHSEVILLSLKARATGRTPAFDVNIREACILDPNSFTHLPDFSSLEPAFQLSPILTGNEESSMDCPVTRGVGEQGYMRAYGELLYVDLFRQKHSATFCFVARTSTQMRRTKASSNLVSVSFPNSRDCTCIECTPARSHGRPKVFRIAPQERNETEPRPNCGESSAILVSQRLFRALQSGLFVRVRTFPMCPFVLERNVQIGAVSHVLHLRIIPITEDVGGN